MPIHCAYEAQKYELLTLLQQYSVRIALVRSRFYSHLGASLFRILTLGVLLFLKNSFDFHLIVVCMDSSQSSRKGSATFMGARIRCPFLGILYLEVHRFCAVPAMLARSPKRKVFPVYTRRPGLSTIYSCLDAHPIYKLHYTRAFGKSQFWRS